MKKKLIWSYFLIIIVAVFITAFFQAKFSKKMYLDEVYSRLKSNASVVNWTLNTKDSIPKLPSNLYKRISERLVLIDGSGKIISDSSKYGNKNKTSIEKLDKKAYLSLMQGKVHHNITKDKKTGKNIMNYAIKIEGGDQRQYILQMAAALKDISIISLRFYKVIVLNIFFAILGGLAIAFFYTRKISKPINQMVKMSQYIAMGNFDTKLNVQSNDEFSVLSSSFNFMVDKLNQLIVELKNRNVEFESILNSMISGVIGIDIKHRILYINPTAQKWFNVDYRTFKGRSVLDVVRSSRLDKAIFNSLEQGIEQRETTIIENRERYYKIIINPIRYEKKVEGAVIVIQDITEEQNYNDMRTQFVANVSHELKTPLTSILGFIETMKDIEIDDKENRDRFLNIIEAEAKRLQNLINDLLEISDLENSKTVAEFSNVNLNNVIDEVILLLSKNSVSKNITIDFECKHSIEIVTNRDMLKQMLINLVDNAIKYTLNKGKVKVIASENDEEIIISVEDNGIGISKEHISRLFERFYRVDKSRSRAQGGTGLGLAIVKHIVMSLDGKIEVLSEINKGSKFIVTLPKKTQKT